MTCYHPYEGEKEKYLKGIIPESVEYEKYCLKAQADEKLKQRETFCEAFFMSSIPYENVQASEICHSFKASCGHEECSSRPAIKPEIILRYPLEDTKNFELNNLAATLCFPQGIKLCYSEKGPTQIMGDYGTLVTNQKGENFYMMTFHFYLKMLREDFYKDYKMTPEAYLATASNSLFFWGEKEKKNFIMFDFSKVVDAEYIYVPCCICLISKYRYEEQMKTCLESIYQLLIENKKDLKENGDLNKLNYLIMYLINSVPIPDVERKVAFYIPHNNPLKNWITLTCPKSEDFKVKDNLKELFLFFECKLIIKIFYLLLFEKRILFVYDDYAQLSRVICYFRELLYPIQWMHTIIPVMSFDTTQYLQTFLPYINGIDTNLLPNALEQDAMADNQEEIFIIYLRKKRKSFIRSCKNGKVSKNNKCFDILPATLYKDLYDKLHDIKERAYKIKDNNFDSINLKIRDCFFEILVEIFKNIKKYIYMLDKNVVFNKKLYLEEVKKDDKKFWDDLMETQLLTHFSQIIYDEEYKNKYFMNKIESNNKTGETFETLVKKYKVNKQYIIEPEYLKINENNIINNSSRIAQKIHEIDKVSKNFALEKKNLCIYLIPEDNEENIKLENKGIVHIKNIDEDKKKDYEIHRRATVLASKEKKKEKEIEEIQELIKEYVEKLFKSDENLMDESENNVLNRTFKNNVQMLINTSEGRQYFITLLTKNKSNVFALKDKYFDMLGDLIYNTLIFLKQANENEEKIEQIIQLTKSTKYFETNFKEKTKESKKGEKNEIKTLWDVYGKKIVNIGYFYEVSFWIAYCNFLLEKEEKKEEVETKKKVILEIFSLMIEFNLNGDIIKTMCSCLAEYLDKENADLLIDIIEKKLKDLNIKCY